MGQVLSPAGACHNDCLSGLRTMMAVAGSEKKDAIQLVTVTVRTLNGNCWTMDFPVTATGREIKSKMRHIWKVPEAEQRLSSGAQIVHDDMQPLRSTSSLHLTRVAAKESSQSLWKSRTMRFGARYVRPSRLGSVRLVGQTFHDRRR
ncbi:unnamed protein product [Cladocopium goreaui]|uniref:Ubiquitin-like domain-containing protein n=1 Tax=Cladocopium goreaui TaxID=2562237 RepID=A0A9P1DM77_9DINO|nr:unnamed protein product [Cladocopium goreaui]|mmetsp:Transcript_47028/g.102376  ORF Transcript_47028/g.102376 Transcript_47028/m.102376 type:complete len:147 (+) Transcript_47028:33-473(+)